MSGITGGEIHKLLEAAAQRTGLDSPTTTHLLLNFSIVWGEHLLDDIDGAIFRDMTRSLGNGTGLDTWSFDDQ